jgi:two-component system CheB/CheR fusion protein
MRDITDARRPRVLVADSWPHGADSAALLLPLLGFEARPAYDGPAAPSAALAQTPDAVVLEVALRRLDGYEVARQLRRRGLGAALLVALTGYGQPAYRGRARAAGFDHFLVKPCDPEELKALQRAPAAPAAGPGGGQRGGRS